MKKKRNEVESEEREKVLRDVKKRKEKEGKRKNGNK
jgi:hypothetical protein